MKKILIIISAALSLLVFNSVLSFRMSAIFLNVDALAFGEGKYTMDCIYSPGNNCIILDPDDPEKDIVLYDREWFYPFF